MTRPALLACGCAAVLSLLAAACAATTEQAPVLQGEALVEYPPALYLEGVAGTVDLRLFVDSTGQVVADSTRLERSSGQPALDSAALAGAARLRYAPGSRNGTPVAMAFVQPVHFRHPGSADSSP